MARRGSMLLMAAIGLGVSGCAGTLPKEMERLGPAPDFAPTFARSAPLTIELARPAYVLALRVHYPSASEPGRPVTFQAQYPAYPTDPTRFEAGRHRLVARQRSGFWPMGCRSEEEPTIDGCRRPVSLLPGFSNFVSARHPRGALLVITSDTFVDPFPLAERLYWELQRDWQRTSRLVEADAATLREEMEPLLLRALGRSGWAASFGVTF
jgi:hypothetical protein